MDDKKDGDDRLLRQKIDQFQLDTRDKNGKLKDIEL